MSPITIIAIVIAVIVAIVVVLKMRAGGEDPGPSREAPKPTTPKPREQAKPQAEPKAKTKPEPAAEPEPRAAEPEPEPEPEPELQPSDLESEPAPPPTPTTSSPEDIAALRKGLKGTRGGFISRLSKLFGKKKELEPEVLDEMEEVLITADLGVATADSILTGLRSAVEEGTIKDGDQAWDAVKGHAREILTRHGGGRIHLSKKPTVILVVGVNGVGKTTTIGKLASRFKEEGKEVLLAAGDTFRAAAVLQLEVWGRRTKCAVVKGKDRADPGSVVFDAIKKAQEDGVDVVIADTAGRLHTKSPLMDELKKVGRTIEKALDRPADEVLLVLDATTGQNAIQQAELFSEALSVNGIALTKLDGTAKGGVILGICDQHQLPVRYVGIGERVEDLKEFEANGFVEALFERPSEENAEA